KMRAKRARGEWGPVRLSRTGEGSDPLVEWHGAVPRFLTPTSSNEPRVSRRSMEVPESHGEVPADRIARSPRDEGRALRVRAGGDARALGRGHALPRAERGLPRAPEPGVAAPERARARGRPGAGRRALAARARHSRRSARVRRLGRGPRRR